jgi:hypothetical protein
MRTTNEREKRHLTFINNRLIEKNGALEFTKVHWDIIKTAIELTLEEVELTKRDHDHLTWVMNGIVDGKQTRIISNIHYKLIARCIRTNVN